MNHVARQQPLGHLFSVPTRLLERQAARGLRWHGGRDEKRRRLLTDQLNRTTAEEAR